MIRTHILVQESFARTCAPMMMKVGGFLFGSVMFLANNKDDDDDDDDDDNDRW